MVQELCQVYYQFSLIILQEKLIKLKSKIVNFLVNTKVSRTIYQNVSVYLVIKIIQTRLMMKIKRIIQEYI